MNACFEDQPLPVATSRVKIPVSCTNVASVVGRDAADVDDDTKDHEAYAGEDLDDTEDEFDLFNQHGAQTRFDVLASPYPLTPKN